MASLTPEQLKELEQEIEEELDDEWDDDGSEAPGAILLRRFGEIRRGILWVFGTMVVFAIAAGMFAREIFEILLKPLCAAIPAGSPPPPGIPATAAARAIGGCALYPTDMMEPMIVYFKMALLVGLFAASPVLFYQVWRIIRPHVQRATEFWVVGFVFSATFFFVGGAAFGFFVVFPRAFEFMLTIAGPRVIPLPTMASYFSIVSMLLLGFGVSFELPLLMFLLSTLGVTNAAFYARYWRHAMFGLLIFSAAVTPTTDPITMAAMGGPLALLYGLGILLSYIGGKRGPTLLESRLKEMEILDEDDEADEDDDGPA